MIFDCDGILVDSERLTAEISAEILTAAGWALSADDVLARFTGCTDEYWKAEVERRTGRVVDAAWEAEHGSRYEQAFDDRLQAVPGIADVLPSLVAPFCVASNGSRARVRGNLRRVGLLEHFEGAVFSAHDVGAGKPEPDLFLHAAARMGVAPDQCVVVEDSVPGVTAARAAGMRCLAYVGGNVQPDLLRGPATTLFASMWELPDLLGV